MEEQRVVRLRIFDQPVHGAQDVRLGRLAHGVLLVVGQDDHVLARVAEVLVEVGAHVLDVVDAAAQLAALAEVVDADEQRLAPARAAAVLEAVALRRALAEGLHGLRRGRGRAVVTLDVGIGVDGRQA